MKRGLGGILARGIILLIGFTLALHGVTTLNLSTTDPDGFYITERSRIAAGSGENILITGKVLTTAFAILILAVMMALMLEAADPHRDKTPFQDYYIHSLAGGLLAASILWLKFLFLDGGVAGTFRPGETSSRRFIGQLIGEPPLIIDIATYGPPFLSLILFLALFVVFTFVIHILFRREPLK